MPPRSGSAPALTFSPTDFHLFAGLPVPDPITFVLSPKWLGRPNLYPRQATLLKVIFLRVDMLTEYDLGVIEEWEISFRETGENGITPGILSRMHQLRREGYLWFREVLLVLGRRAGKGYVAALAMAYVLWNYLALGDPQGHFGVDRDKQLACFIYAGKKEQARENLWKDLVNVIQGGECFTSYISRPLGETLSVFAPHDFVRMRNLQSRGINSERDMATFVIQPKEATLMSGRGPTSFMQGYDEMAHQVASGANRSAEEVYGAATPALDQFKKWAFIIEPSSPWQMIGQFYTNYQNCMLEDEDGNPVYPNTFFLQLCSWEMYYDWMIAPEIDLFPIEFEGDLGEYAEEEHPRLSPLKGAIQEYDEGMQKLEQANPETFAVERRSHWQATVNAYLNPNMVDAMFGPWNGEVLQMKTEGLLSIFYKGHADPSLANANFAVAIAHPEKDDNGVIHCVFDYIHHWRPSDFDNNIIDYPLIDDYLWRIIKGFKPDEFTFDQWNSANSIARLNNLVRQAKFPKRVTVYEKTSTHEHNWNRAENFKIGLNQGWIHAPEYEQAQLELKFLRVKNGNKVEKQDAGPVQTKDVSDCYSWDMEVLTEHGWKLFKDVEQGERVATRSPEGVLEYQVPTEYIERYHTGMMYEYESSGLSFSVTPKHRMLVEDQDGRQRFVHAEDLVAKQYFVPKTALLEERESTTISFDTEDLSATSRRVQGRGGDRSQSGWTAEQDAYLIEHYATTSMTELCEVLGKTREAIYNRAKPKNLDLKRGQIGDRIGDRPKPLPETKVEDFAAFLGIWLAEGRKMRDKRGYDVKITQTKPEGVEWIDNLFARLPWPVKRSVQANGETIWVVKSRGLREYLRACQGEGHELLIPDEVFANWTQREMEALLEGLSVGDGCWSKVVNRFVGYYSTSKQLVDDVQRLLAHVGMSGRARIVQRASQYQANHDLWYVSYKISKRATLRTAQLRQVEYDGPVYCLTVPNSTLLVRRKGVPMWSGNCLMECAWTILGEQVHAWTHGALSELSLRAHVQGGFDPHQRETAMDDPVLQQLSSPRGRAQQYGWRGGGRNPSRNVFANRNRR